MPRISKSSAERALAFRMKKNAEFMEQLHKQLDEEFSFSSEASDFHRSGFDDVNEPCIQQLISLDSYDIMFESAAAELFSHEPQLASEFTNYELDAANLDVFNVSEDPYMSQYVSLAQYDHLPIVCEVDEVFSCSVDAQEHDLVIDFVGPTHLEGDVKISGVHVFDKSDPEYEGKLRSQVQSLKENHSNLIKAVEILEMLPQELRNYVGGKLSCRDKLRVMLHSDIRFAPCSPPRPSVEIGIVNDFEYDNDMRGLHYRWHYGPKSCVCTSAVWRKPSLMNSLTFSKALRRCCYQPVRRALKFNLGNLG